MSAITQANSVVVKLKINVPTSECTSSRPQNFRLLVHKNWQKLCNSNSVAQIFLCYLKDDCAQQDSEDWTTTTPERKLWLKIARSARATDKRVGTWSVPGRTKHRLETDQEHSQNRPSANCFSQSFNKRIQSGESDLLMNSFYLKNTYQTCA